GGGGRGCQRGRRRVTSSTPQKPRGGRWVFARHSRSIGSASIEAWAEPGAGPARWITKAIAGAIATMTKGKMNASVRMPTASRRISMTSGDDNSMTGNSVNADIDQSDTSRRPVNGAIRAGASSTAKTGPAARRGGGDDGKAISLTAARLGRARKKTIKSGTATYATLPAR